MTIAAKNTRLPGPVVSREVAADVSGLANKERRTVSAMVAVLVAEALEARAKGVGDAR